MKNPPQSISRLWLHFHSGCICGGSGLAARNRQCISLYCRINALFHSTSTTSAEDKKTLTHSSVHGPHELKRFQCAFLTLKQKQLCCEKGLCGGSDHFVFSLRAALLAYSCVFLSLFISTCEFNTVNVSPCVAAVCCRPSCRPYGWERSQCWRERTLHWTRCWIWGRDTHKHVCANACRIYTALISLCSVCLCSVWTLYSEQRRVSDEKYWTSWEFNYVMQQTKGLKIMKSIGVVHLGTMTVCS